MLHPTWLHVQKLILFNVRKHFKFDYETSASKKDLYSYEWLHLQNWPNFAHWRSKLNYFSLSHFLFQKCITKLSSEANNYVLSKVFCVCFAFKGTGMDESYIENSGPLTRVGERHNHFAHSSVLSKRNVQHICVKYRNYIFLRYKDSYWLDSSLHSYSWVWLVIQILFTTKARAHTRFKSNFFPHHKPSVVLSCDCVCVYQITIQPMDFHST
jgi:hypothetical protein